MDLLSFIQLCRDVEIKATELVCRDNHRIYTEVTTDGNIIRIAARCVDCETYYIVRIDTLRGTWTTDQRNMRCVLKGGDK